MKNISDEKKCLICLALVIMRGLLLFYTYADDSGKNQHEGIIRLHVIANSNKVGDQALKLKVRDAVIEYMEEQKDLKNADETRTYLAGNLDRFEKIAEGIIASEGYDYTANVDMGVRYIPQKTYGDITFPAGNYEALNITIGSGQGENWWCVLFPPLCLLEEGTENLDNMTPEEIDKLKSEGLLTESSSSNTTDSSSGSDSSSSSDSLTEEQALQLKWKTLELLNKK